MKKGLGTNPWFSMWVKPRETIGKIINFNVNHRFGILCYIYGLQYIFQVFQQMSFSKSFSLPASILIALVLAFPVGYILLNLFSFFIFLLGKIIKGKATFKQVRAANFWASVPNVVMLALWIVLMFTIGSQVFVTGYEAALMGSTAYINKGVQLGSIVLGIWGFIIFLHALGQVQGFSAWMALLNCFLSGIAIFGIYVLIVSLL
ncbi:hypothetical protein COB21_04585 [Candidatus Aerophobetes bacterium]|uniref:Yip1 domain-containing protein n=1 Tax=Aerophobetes bacterium TaxID=2030807 RepID=A0A2A4X0P1_UNCAE|nr:MAG: hypothetical protein COB21_04585 [Candidatus Aerophobetes bacterium]